MTEFKQWYDEDGITFHSEHKVQFSQSNSMKKMSFYEMVLMNTGYCITILKII